MLTRRRKKPEAAQNENIWNRTTETITVLKAERWTQHVFSNEK